MMTSKLKSKQGVLCRVQIQTKLCNLLKRDLFAYKIMALDLDHPRHLHLQSN
jgi:hypothetical protein